MQERERLLWAVLIILLLIIGGYMGFNAFRMGQKVRVYQEAMASQSMGSEDPQLRRTIEQLEADLSERMAYQFTIDHDPLDLTQVIRSRRFLRNLGFTESLEASNKMRLSCTVIANIHAAIIKFQGRSRVLYVGDKIDEYRISEIERNRVVLVRGSEKLVLATEKAPDTIEREAVRQAGSITYGSSDNSPRTGNF